MCIEHQNLSYDIFSAVHLEPVAQDYVQTAFEIMDLMDIIITTDNGIKAEK